MNNCSEKTEQFFCKKRDTRLRFGKKRMTRFQRSWGNLVVTFFADMGFENGHGVNVWIVMGNAYMATSRLIDMLMR